MSPQPTTAPAPAESKQEHAPGSPGWAIDLARKLEFERGKLMKRIGANRDFLRNLHEMGALNAEQRKFVTTFYPEKGKGTTRDTEQAEATRKARAEARKGA